MGGLAGLAKKGLDEHTLTSDSHKPCRPVLKKFKMQASGMVRLSALAKKGLDEHMLMFDSHKPRRSALNKRS